MSSVHYEFREGVARITLDRPDKLNSFSAGMRGELLQALERVGAGDARALILTGGGSYFLPRLAGTARAMGLALTGERLSAEQAAEWGLIWQCLDDEKLMPEAEALAARFAQGPPLAYAAIKRTLYASPENTLERQLDLERDTQRTLGASADYREGVAAFMEKRPPAFRGK